MAANLEMFYDDEPCQGGTHLPPFETTSSPQHDGPGKRGIKL
jgi:hypothetical protein